MRGLSQVPETLHVFKAKHSQQHEEATGVAAVVCSLSWSRWYFPFVTINFWGTEVSIFPETHLADEFKKSVCVCAQIVCTCACVRVHVCAPASGLVLTGQSSELVHSLTNMSSTYGVVGLQVGIKSGKV